MTQNPQNPNGPEGWGQQGETPNPYAQQDAGMQPAAGSDLRPGESPQAKTNFVTALIGLIVGAVSLFILGFLSVVGLIVSAVALVRTSKLKNRQGRDKTAFTLAVIGTIVGAVATIFFIIGLIMRFNGTV